MKIKLEMPTKATINKKVLDYYLKFPQKTDREVSEATNVNIHSVSTVLSCYFRDLHVFKDLCFCFSLQNSERLGFLFSGGIEKEVLIIENEIQNTVDFTQYELDWLRINYNLSTTVRKLKNKIKFVEKVKYKREVIYLDENKKRIKK